MISIENFSDRNRSIIVFMENDSKVILTNILYPDNILVVQPTQLILVILNILSSICHFKILHLQDVVLSLGCEQYLLEVSRYLHSDA